MPVGPKVFINVYNDMKVKSENVTASGFYAPTEIYIN